MRHFSEMNFIQLYSMPFFVTNNDGHDGYSAMKAAFSLMKIAYIIMSVMFMNGFHFFYCFSEYSAPV